MVRSQRTTARRRLPIAAFVIAGAVALAGCTRAVDSQPNTSSPVAGGTLAVAAAADAQPQFVMANRAGNWSWRRLVFESLVELDDAAKPQPLLATSWRYNDDRTQLLMRLRDDVRFHSGRQMTAADVVFTLKQVKDPRNASQLVKVAGNITSVEASGDHEVTINLAASSDSLFDLLDLTPIVDSETWDGIRDGTKVIGTGPFLWSKWTPGASISLKRNPGYRVPERPYLDAVEISIISDSTALQTALKGGSADVALGMAQSDVSLLKADDAFALASAGGVFYPLGVDVTLPPFDRKEVRQALGYAIDRERIREQVFGGDAVTSDLWWTPGSPGYPQGLANHYTYDPDQAKQMLAAAGVAGAEVTVTFANLPVMRNLFEIVQNNLTQVGLTVKANGLDLTEYDKRQVEGKLGQSFLLLHGMVGFSPATLVDAMPSIRAGNPSHFDTPAYNERKTAVKQSTEQTREQALRDLSSYMLDQAFSHIVAIAPQYHVHSSALRGLDVVSLGSIVVTDAYLAR